MGLAAELSLWGEGIGCIQLSYTNFRHKKETAKLLLFWLTSGTFVFKKILQLGSWFLPILNHLPWKTQIKATQELRVYFLTKWTTYTRRIKWQFLHVSELWIGKIVSATLINGNFKEECGPSITFSPNYCPAENCILCAFQASKKGEG